MSHIKTFCTSYIIKNLGHCQSLPPGFSGKRKPNLRNKWCRSMGWQHWANLLSPGPLKNFGFPNCLCVSFKGHICSTEAQQLSDLAKSVNTAVLAKSLGPCHLLHLSNSAENSFSTSRPHLICKHFLLKDLLLSLKMPLSTSNLGCFGCVGRKIMSAPSLSCFLPF